MISSDSKYIDAMIKTIVSEKYETIKNLHDYSVEEFIALYEIILVNTVTKALAMNKVKSEMASRR